MVFIPFCGPALEFAEKASTMRMKKLSYHIYRFLLSEIPFLDHVAEDVQKLSRHFVGALKLWETDKESAKCISLEITLTIHVRSITLLPKSFQASMLNISSAVHIPFGRTNWPAATIPRAVLAACSDGG